MEDACTEGKLVGADTELGLIAGLPRPEKSARPGDAAANALSTVQDLWRRTIPTSIFGS